MTTGSSYDVIVIGGGPVGCRVAYGTAGAGLRTAVLERKPALEAPICCTGLVSQECFNRFRFSTTLVGSALSRATVFSPGGRQLSIERSSIQAYCIRRPELDRGLQQAAQENGADYLWNHKVADVSKKGECYEVQVQTGEGCIGFSSKALVMATGFGSRLLKKIGIRPGRDWVIGAQAEAGTHDSSGVEIYTGREFAPGFFAWVVPVGGNRAHVGLMSRKNAHRHHERFVRMLRERGKIVWPSKPLFRGITLSNPSTTWSERLLLVGDCAGQVKPITGGGLYFGLLCADIAARHISQVLGTKNASPVALSAYEKEWKALLGRELSLGAFARRVYGLMGDTELELAFSAARRLRLAENLANSKDIGFDWHGAALVRSIQLMNPLKSKE